VHDLPAALRSALAAAASQYPPPVVASTTARLIDRYQQGDPAAAEPILRSTTDAVAYATYRMPATYAAVRSALAELHSVAPDFAPRVHLDLGGGTGAAVWAVADVWPDRLAHTVWEHVDMVAQLGRRLAASATTTLRYTDWHHRDITEPTPLPNADLVTVSYLLGELEPPARAQLVITLGRHGGVVVIVEPGTVAGHQRILQARDALLAAGRRILAPCPHPRQCPMARAGDWCHFAARVHRSVEHRKAKSATKGHEDEKFAYLVVTPTPHAAAAARIVRHPQVRKGLVGLQLCTAAGEVSTELVSKRRGDTYRAARRASWGDAWPPPDAVPRADLDAITPGAAADSH